MEARAIVVLEGDETGQELLEEALRVLQPDVVELRLEFPRYDLSLENRRATANGVVHEAARAIREHGLGLKAATVTPEGAGDVGSPNRILREEIGGRVIVRTGRRIPASCRSAGCTRRSRSCAWRSATRTARRSGARARATTRLRFARSGSSGASATRSRSSRSARRSGPARRSSAGRSTRSSPVYEGMLKEEMDAAARRHPDVVYEPQLIDATFALLIASTGDPMVIPALNRDGDILSDLVLPLFGSIAGSESLLVAFDDGFEPDALMAEAAHGTAPALQGKNVANPMAMILAGAALLSHGDSPASQRAGRAIRESCLEAVAQGIRTADLQGHSSTTEFTDEVIERTRTKLEVWATL